MKLIAREKRSLYELAARNALGFADHPPAILWVLTQRCFYRCVHCDSWRDERAIDSSALLKIAAKIAAAETGFVALSGGEPTMVKALPEIVEMLKRAGKIVSLNTNGHLLEESARWLVDSGIDHVQISIDAPEAELHDAIRRRAGSFETILRGVSALRAARRDELPKISICGVLMKENAERLTEFFTRFEGIADSIEIQPIHDSPGFMAASAGGVFAPTDRAALHTQLETARRRHPVLADSYHRQFENFVFDAPSMQNTATDHCFPRIFSTLTIREDGGCFICRYPLHRSIHDQEIAEVWRAPERLRLYRELAAAGCATPCWLRCYIHPSPLPGKVMKTAVRMGLLARG